MDSLRQLKLIRKEAARIADLFNNIQTGSGTTDAAGDASVTFPAPYSSAPRVFLQGVDAAARGIVLDVVSKLTTGFSVKARKVTGLPTDYGMINLGYTTASAVTAIPAATGSALGSHSHTVNSHTHSIGAATTASFVTGGSDPGHTHTNPTTGTPSAPTVNVATSPAGWGTLYAASISGGSPTSAFAAAQASFYTAVASSTHTHTQGDTGSSTTGITLFTSSAVTAIPSATGSASPGTSSVDLSHTHSIGAATTASFVDGLFLPVPPDPIYWKEFVTGGAPVLSADFDWLAILL